MMRWFQPKSLAVTAAAAAVVTAAGGAAAMAAPAANTATWSSTATQALKLVHATPLGALPATTKLSLAIGLRLRDSAGLAALNKEITTPHSAQFGHFLTPAQFTARYAPTAAQVSAVTNYLKSQGLTSVAVTSNRLYITADATAAQAEKAFNTSLETYSQFGHTIYANTAAAQVPSSLSGTVLSVLGLNDIHGFTFGLKARHATAAAPSSTPSFCQPTSYALCDYNPAGFRLAYDAGSLTGSKTTIAIMAEGDVTGVVKDLRTAEAAFGEAQVPVTIEHVGLHSTDTSGADEFDLDTQYSTGMAGTVKRLYIYDTTSLTDSDIGLEFNKWASQDLAKGGSASFGECDVTPYADGLMVTNDEVMNEAAAQGQTMHASSGDTGGQSCAVAPTNGAPESGAPDVNYPCSSPYIVCVGGTTLFSNADGSYDTEIGWVAGGGGISAVEYSPYWQSCVAPTNTADDRGVPDIAMDADENTGADVYVNGAAETVGGTSLSSPLALGVWAILETTHFNMLGFAAPILYGFYPTSSCVAGANPQTGQLGTTGNDPSYPFHDIYLGSNAAYQNTYGWDYVTGLGTYDIAKTSAGITVMCGPLK